MPPIVISIAPPISPSPAEHSAIAKADAASLRSGIFTFRDEFVLGTRLEILISALSAAIAKDAALAARQEIERLDGVFNLRRTDSELSNLNRTRLAMASAELFAVVRLGEMWRHITHGAFDGRMGKLLSLWTEGTAPGGDLIKKALAAMRISRVVLHESERRIALSSDAVLSLDAIAKGYIVDAALNAARRAAPAIDGMAVGIGGDIRCWGMAPSNYGWRIGIPDATALAENAPLVDAVVLQNAAIATSGRGPRDCIGGRLRSTTISPFTGRPVRQVISASVVASHVADADAIATACLVLQPNEGLALVDRLDGVAVRITDAQGRVHESPGWSKLRIAAAPTKKTATKTSPEESAQKAEGKSSSSPPELRWPNDWEIGIHYIAPERQEQRSADFRTPYMALWITDAQNNPIRTLFMVGPDPEWQKDNFIWWNSHRERAKQLVDIRSQATSLSGRYPMYWGGVDEDWRPVPIGKYILHLETSQERGKHNYRSIALEIGRDRFKAQLPILPESGGLDITFGHYNDRFKSDD